MPLFDGNMAVHQRKGVTFLTFPALDSLDFIVNAFSTRIGGVSKDEFSSMNLSFGRGDSDENVSENYRRMCAAIGVGEDSLTFSAQDHHTFIRQVTVSDKGVGYSRPRDIDSVDGIVTNARGVTLVTHYADCVPIYFVDPVKKAIGLSHAGWRGTVAGIAKKTVRAMGTEFSCEPKDLLCAIGPSICAACYEVDEGCAGEFYKLGGISHDKCVHKKDGKYFADLWETNRQLLISAGVPGENISVSALCTRENSGELFSHRASAGKRGGLAAFLALR